MGVLRKGVDLTPQVDATEVGLLLDQVTVTPTGDDKGVIFNNQISVIGEIVAGADSYPVPLAFHCTEANTTGKTIVNAVDITTILQSDEESSTGLFNGTTAGNYILVASSALYEGAKIKYDSLATVEPDNMIAEFYQNDTELWTGVSFMGTNSAYPYEAEGNSISQHLSEQVFFGFNPLIRDEDSVWELATFNINGVDYGPYYWARLRLSDAITGDPLVQQIKLHTNRHEVEANGIFKYGRARTKVCLPFDTVKNDNYDPFNEVVNYTPQYQADFIDNELSLAQTDGFGVIVNRVSGLDTSIPVVIDISFYVKGTATGTFKLYYEVSQVVDGFIYDGNEPYDSYTYTQEITSDQNEKRFSVKLLASINKLQSNSAIVVSLYRNPADVEDTLAASLVRTNIQVTGYVWKI